MIINVPNSDDLNDVALRLYFAAWQTLRNIETDFWDVNVELQPEERDTEYRDYIEACQPELQMICTLIQQSNELALKARICEISPFLLLLRSDAKFKAAGRDVDFSEFRTLDAVDLPNTVNAVCKQRLGDTFVKSYNIIRAYRNKIAHLGQSPGILLPQSLLDLLINQYLELWSGRGWLADRLYFAGRTRQSFFHDGTNYSPATAVMHDLPDDFESIRPAQFQRLFGQKKSTRRYRCHECIFAAETDYSDLDFDNCKTAYVDKSGRSLRCIMCVGEFETERRPCGNPDCKSSLISVEGQWEGCCHGCGEYAPENKSGP